ncbi:InlB B-repeat-containing protein [Cohnella cholangitidis]|uniref:InlB B-repeat-containing protein n=1 Tax=Cohnella cholangitidis TaxID=2598458 RepID=UPI0015FC7BAF|nr:InlB B-repeat-containing protein [Cohnella cholangitidis]
MSTSYGDMQIAYSGFDGTGGNPGIETITITGITKVNLEIRAAAFANGGATVNYSYSKYVEEGSATTYTVTYNAGANGTISATSETVTENGHPANVPTVTANGGYTFTGWSKDGGTTLLSEADIKAATVTGNVTYTAYYSQNTFTVTYAPGTNGTISATSEVVAENGHPANVPTVTANDGYTFTGWSKDGGTTLLSKADIEATTVTGNVTYTAYYSQNTFTVTYAPGTNGTISATSEVVAENGHPANVPTVTANDGYTFTAWSKDGGTTLLAKRISKPRR